MEAEALGEALRGAPGPVSSARLTPSRRRLRALLAAWSVGSFRSQARGFGVIASSTR